MSDTDNHFVAIPYEKLSNEALRGVIEEFVTRDGTDYGLVEVELDRKIDNVLRQLKNREVFIVYDELSMTTNIVPKDEIIKLKHA
jgi:uncharacterized protein